MGVAVVDIRIVRMPMSEQLMTVRVNMWFLPIPGEIMRMLVMLVVTMGVTVLERLVHVNVLVSLPKVQPYARAHERCRSPEGGAGCLRPQQQ